MRLASPSLPHATHIIFTTTSHTVSVRPTTGLQQDPLPWRIDSSGLYVTLLSDAPFEARPLAIYGSTLPSADVSVQNVLDVLHNEVDGHWWETGEEFVRQVWWLRDDHHVGNIALTHIVYSPWNDNICILLSLGENNKKSCMLFSEGQCCKMIW